MSIRSGQRCWRNLRQRVQVPQWWVPAHAQSRHVVQLAERAVGDRSSGRRLWRGKAPAPGV